MKKDIRFFVKWVSLAVAIFGVIAYRELPDWWYLIAWFPITFGYAIHYAMYD